MIVYLSVAVVRAGNHLHTVTERDTYAFECMIRILSIEGTRLPLTTMTKVMVAYVKNYSGLKCGNGR